MSSPILDMTFDQYDSLPKGEQAALLLEAGSSTGVESIGALTVRVREFVHLNSILNQPVSLSSLNRRFNRPASRLGTSIKSVVGTCLRSGELELLQHKNRSALFSPLQMSLLDRTSTLALERILDQTI